MPREILRSRRRKETKKKNPHTVPSCGDTMWTGEQLEIHDAPQHRRRVRGRYRHRPQLRREALGEQGSSDLHLRNPSRDWSRIPEYDGFVRTSQYLPVMHGRNGRTYHAWFNRIRNRPRRGRRLQSPRRMMARRPCWSHYSIAGDGQGGMSGGGGRMSAVVGRVASAVAHSKEQALVWGVSRHGGNQGEGGATVAARAYTRTPTQCRGKEA
ncbi:hypothetical protein C8R46DRAFT_1074914 [Mycena filopes]|nr:hypothetical protein C8R46DRAFT_1074914 [Mycena filopes]